MDTSHDFDTGHTNLVKLMDWYTVHELKRNESTTRLHLIDKMLQEVLGWAPEQIENEVYGAGEFADYTLSSKSRPFVIVEAKREGVYFELPIGNNKIKYSIKSLHRQEDALKAVLEQVSKYCQARGVQIAVVTNGHQYIVFVAVRTDGVAPMSGNALVFESIEFIEKHFKTFWNCLSVPGIEEQYAYENLIGDVIAKLPPKISNFLNRYPGTKGRNPFQSNMQILSELVLQDVVREKDVEAEFLKQCYSKSGAISQYSSVSKELLKTRYKYLFEKDNQKMQVSSVISKKGLDRDLTDLLANSLARRPIMLIGDVGVGKSTFIENLMKVEAKEIFDKSIGIKIDLGSKAVLKQDLREAIFDEIENVLLVDYDTDIKSLGFIKGAYHLDLQRFKSGPLRLLQDAKPELAVIKEYEYLQGKILDRANHIKASLNHISKARREQIIIFIDNCDQRSDATQQDAFLISQEIADSWPALIFVALRPETFHRSLREGALSGYHPKAFTISPPRIDDVIIRRLEFAKLIASGDVPISTLNISADFTSLYSLLDILIYSLQFNKELVSFIDNISNGNIRMAIDYVMQFLGSGHVDTRKILQIHSEAGRYYIPLHEFQRAVIYGNNVYYDPSRTSIFNLYDVTTKDEKEHFLSPTLLALLQAQVNTGIRDGFIKISQVYSELQSAGYTVVQIDNMMKKLYRARMIETSQRGDIIEESSLPSLVRITSLGSYHITSLISTYTYNDAIIVDVPLFSNTTREILRVDGSILDRLDSVVVFYEYLRTYWDKTSENHKRIYNWQKDHDRLIDQISEIRSKIQN